MRYLRSLVFLPLMTVCALILFVLAYLPRKLTESFYYRAGRFWCGLFVRSLGVDLELVPKNERPLPQQYILIANHPSSMEDFGIPSLFHAYALAKEGVRHWFIVGRIAEHSGAIFFDREDASSRHAAKAAMIEALDEGKSVMLFPEGGIFSRRIAPKFKTGAFDASIKTGIPILPLFLHYEDEAAFEWLDPDTLLKNLWDIYTADSDKARYYLFDALYPEDYKDAGEFRDRVHQMYLEWQDRYLEPLD